MISGIAMAAIATTAREHLVRKLVLMWFLVLSSRSSVDPRVLSAGFDRRSSHANLRILLEHLLYSVIDRLLVLAAVVTEGVLADPPPHQLFALRVI
jgi:hypothetical protein